MYSNPFLHGPYLESLSFLKWVEANFESCRDLLTMAIIAYDHPVRGEFAETNLQMLNERGILSPKQYQYLLNYRAKLKESKKPEELEEPESLGNLQLMLDFESE